MPTPPVQFQHVILNLPGDGQTAAAITVIIVVAAVRIVAKIIKWLPFF